jgi:hypothetical protein
MRQMRRKQQNKRGNVENIAVVANVVVENWWFLSHLQRLVSTPNPQPLPPVVTGEGEQYICSNEKYIPYKDETGYYLEEHLVTLFGMQR